MTNRAVLVAYTLLALNMAIYGVHATVGRIAAGDIPPMALSFWRWLLALLVLLPFAWPMLRRQWPLVVANGTRLIGASLLMVVGFTTLFYLGLNDTTAINGGLINSAAPVVIVFVTWVARVEHLTLRQGIGLALSMLGVVVVICRGDLTVLWTLRFHLGDLIVLAAVFCFALYSLVLRGLPREFDYLTLMVVGILIGLPFLVPIYAWEYAETGPFPLTPGNLVVIAYVVLGPAVIGYFTWMQGVRVVGANKSAFMYNLVPVFSVISAILLLDERFEVHHAIGFALIFLGMYLALLGKGVKLARAPTA